MPSDPSPVSANVADTSIVADIADMSDVANAAGPAVVAMADRESPRRRDRTRLAGDPALRLTGSGADDAAAAEPTAEARRSAASGKRRVRPGREHERSPSAVSTLSITSTSLAGPGTGQLRMSRSRSRFWWTTWWF